MSPHSADVVLKAGVAQFKIAPKLDQRFWSWSDSHRMVNQLFSD